MTGLSPEYYDGLTMDEVNLAAQVWEELHSNSKKGGNQTLGG